MPSSPSGGPPTSTGFVSLQQYLDANKDATNNMVNQLVGHDVSAADAAKAADQKLGQEAQAGYKAGGNTFDPTQLADYSTAQQQTNAAVAGLQGLTTPGGLQSQVQDLYGKQGGYTQGDNAFDSMLAGAAGQQAFQNAQNQFKDLGDYLNNQIQPPAAPDSGPSANYNPTPRGAKNNPYGDGLTPTGKAKDDFGDDRGGF